ncbi:hypothetical protein KVG96_15720 [Pseudomonas sp. COR58]|uniref:Uncharacterized protein n=1 Tax=Pseudomonas ekonensis TaxID=2842353 RepID=A0ABS6PFZ7_9PSED|nr:hypothetical protein [Pseudomonas ekonensis]MBV4459402.1 hypothetical protein [Pseudomonas ekonensis]
MDAERDDCEGQEPEELPLINDPGNEDPGSLMDDVLVPLWEDSEAGEFEYNDYDDDE